MRIWYRIATQQDGVAADLYVYDEIGRSFWDDDTVSAKQFIEDLRALPDSVKTLRVHVNSPGGDPFDATAIANALRAQRVEKGRTIEVSIEGLAASAATIITCAGDTIRIADNALFMVHNPWSIELGDAKAMRAMADALDRIRDSIVATYQWVSSLSAEAIQALMDATTWMDASQAVASGFATEVVSGVEAAAAFRVGALARLGDVPEPFRARVAALTAKKDAPPTDAAPSPADPKAVIQACKTAGFAELADDLLNLPMDQVTARLEEKKAAKTAAEARATEIRALCAMAFKGRSPEFIAATADDYIAGGMATPQIKAQLTRVSAELASVPIDNRQPAESGRGGGGALNVTEIYSARNGLAKGA